MIKSDAFYDVLQQSGITFFTGVPDSLLKDFCAYVSDNADRDSDIIAANEGAAVALAAGYHLATGRIGMVYMQNSGIGNAVNPLISLVDPDVYNIPVLLFIGWRGEPGVKDEPQHVKQGKITLPLMETLGIPCEVLPETLEKARDTVERAARFMREHEAPYAIVVRKDTFETYKKRKLVPDKYAMDREEAVQALAANLTDDDVVVSTTGKTSRELFEYRAGTGAKHEGDFLTVGSMGHASQIALGIALAKPDRHVFCFDGDGAVIMHMGSMAIIASRQPKNFCHIVFNNGAHDSVGGQPTAGYDIDLTDIAKGYGYSDAVRIDEKTDIAQTVERAKSSDGPMLIDIRVNKGSRADLGRPTIPPRDNKKGFMENLAR